MTLAWAPYQSATGCDKYGPAGAQALLTYTEDVFAELHRSLGICNCRPVRGGSAYSHHAECRAYDAGFTIIVGATFAYDYAVLLGEHAAEAGIDHAITNRKPWASDRGEPIIFSARSPNGRTYTGTHPHKDHNHIGLTRNAGRFLTYGTLVHLYGPPSAVAARLLHKEDEDMIMRWIDEPNLRQLYKDGAVQGASEDAVVKYWITERSKRTMGETIEASINVMKVIGKEPLRDWAKPTFQWMIDAGIYTEQTDLARVREAYDFQQLAVSMKRAIDRVASSNVDQNARDRALEADNKADAAHARLDRLRQI